jgi:PAS domain-containing protein
MVTKEDDKTHLTDEKAKMLQGQADLNSSLVELLEKQKTELVIRVLKKHEELQAGKEFTNKILTSLTELFFLLDKDLFVVQCNNEFSECLGYTLDKEFP